MEEIKPQLAKSISDDQDLAEVLSGVSQDKSSDFTYEETPVGLPSMPSMPPAVEPVAMPEVPSTADDAITITPFVKPEASHEDLESIKKTALQELRPLVDKLNLSAEEKFDIYLLLLRSTDDTTLIAPAHTTAQQIEDEAKRAQALLDIIKEIDFLAKPV